MAPTPSPDDPRSELPPVDLRLVSPESRYEIFDGRVEYVPPSDPPHGIRHSKLSALLEAYAGEEWEVASDMLTRTSEIDDIAPDASVFHSAPDPRTGGRKLEELAFEVVSTERLSKAAVKAKKLADRGVRRVFAIDVSRQRALEWSAALGTWELLAANAEIDDATLAAPLPVEALVRTAKVDDAVAHALLRKKNPVLESTLLAECNRARAEGRAIGEAEGRAQGKAEAVVALLEARGIAVAPADRARIFAMTDDDVLNGWVALAVRCESVEELFSAR